MFLVSPRFKPIKLLVPRLYFTYSVLIYVSRGEKVHIFLSTGFRCSILYSANQNLQLYLINFCSVECNRKNSFNFDFNLLLSLLNFSEIKEKKNVKHL